MEDRYQVLCEFYHQSPETIAHLAALKHGPDRKHACGRFGINPHIFRTMVDYNRYYEAQRVYDWLTRFGTPCERLRVVDFGCLVADYGLFFARRGASVTIYDFPEYASFAEYRFQREELGVRVMHVPTEMQSLMENQSLVIFGEVLEHLDDPISPVRACTEARVQYLFTSCYPFGDEKYFALPGHSRRAQALQPECIKWLSTNYKGTNTHKKAWLWSLVT